MLTPRTLDIMAAYSIDEQRHLYHKTNLLIKPEGSKAMKWEDWLRGV